MSNRTPRFLLGAVVFLVVLCCGCRVQTDVAVSVDPDGSGTVTVTVRLDEEAAAELGDDPAEQVRLDDVEAAGWKVDGPRRDGNDTVITASKPFGTADRLGEVMAELGGDGLFREWRLVTNDSFTVSSYELDGSIVVSGTLDQFSDAEVASALDGFALGRTAEELAAALAEHPDAFTLGVEVALPGSFDRVEGLDAVEGSSNVARATWTVGAGDSTATTVSVRSSEADRTAVLWILVGAVLVVGSAVLAAAAWRVGRRRSVSRPSPR